MNIETAPGNWTSTFRLAIWRLAACVGLAVLLVACQEMSDDSGCPAGYSMDGRGVCVVGCPTGYAEDQRGVCVPFDDNDDSAVGGPFHVEPAVALVTPEHPATQLRLMDSDGAPVALGSYQLELPSGSPLQAGDTGSVEISGAFRPTTVEVVLVHSSGSRHSATVVVARPSGTAVLYRDTDLLIAPTPSNPDADFGAGAGWRATISSEVGVAVGVLLLPAEESSFAGQIVQLAPSAIPGAVDVVVEFRQPSDLFDEVDISGSLPLSVDSGWLPEPGWAIIAGADGAIAFEPGDPQQKSLTPSIECKADGRLVEVTFGLLPRLELHSSSFSLDTDWQDERKALVLVGGLTTTFRMGTAQLEVGAGGEVSCRAILGRLPLTSLGILGSLLGVPSLEFGVRFKLKAAANIVELSGNIEVTQTDSLEVGIICERGACQFVGEASSTDVQDNSRFELVGPDETTRAEATLGVFVTLAIVSDPSFAEPRRIIEAQAGLEANATFALPAWQLNAEDSRSQYGLDVVAEVGFSDIVGAVEQIGEWLNLRIDLPSLRFSQELGRSPTATIEAITPTPMASTATSVRIRLANESFLGIFNVDRIQLYEVRRGAGLPSRTLIGETDTIAVDAQVVSIPWTPAVDGAHELAAFVTPALFGVLGPMLVATREVTVGEDGGTPTAEEVIAACCGPDAGPSWCPLEPGCPGPAPNDDDPQPVICECDEYAGYCDEGCDCDAECRIEAPIGEFVLVSAGTFLMGSPDGEFGRSVVEGQRSVTLTRDFEVMRHEVTQADWLEIAGAALPASSDGCDDETCPLTGLNWWEAIEFSNRVSIVAGEPPCYILGNCVGEFGAGMMCEWSGLSAVSSPYACQGYRLPTEAEWEYAARAGDSRATYNGELTDWCGGVLDDVAVHCAATPRPVGSLSGNALGIYDMLGNAAEWVWDTPIGASDGTARVDPFGEAGVLGRWYSDQRVSRGGSYYEDARVCRSAASTWNADSDSFDGQGLRLVRTR